jgi:hypothetical protein
LHDVPFQANISDIELSLSLALEPHISLQLELFGGLLSMTAGPVIDLPKTTVTMTQLATESVNALCEDSSAGESISAAASQEFQDLFENLTHITGDVELGVGLDLEGGIRIPEIGFTTTIGLTSLPVATLPTRCLAVQTAAASAPMAFTPAASVLAEIEASVSASSASASRASASAAASSGGSEQSATAQTFVPPPSRHSLLGFAIMLAFAIL